MLLSLITILCIIVIGINVTVIIINQKELKQIDQKYNELMDELTILKNNKKYENFNNLNNNEKSKMDTPPSITTIKKKPIVKIDNVSDDDQNTYENDIQNNNPNNRFISILKDRCRFYNGKYVIDKRLVATTMVEYNDTYGRNFGREYIVICDKLFLTQAGVNYIDRIVKSVFNDLVDNVLVIEFYKEGEISNDTNENNLIDLENVRHSKIIDITEMIA